MRKVFTAMIVILVSGLTLDGQEEPDMVTDRPDQTESAEVVPLYRLQIETGFAHEWVHTGDDSYDQNTVYGGTLLRFGFHRILEARLGTDLLNHRFKQSTDTPRKEFGVSPLGVGLKVKILKEKGILPDIAIIANYQIPGTGRKEFSSDKFQQGYVFAFAHTLTSNLGLGYNLGYEFEGAFETNRFIYTLVFGYSASEKIGLFIETYGNKSTNINMDIRADAGITFLVRPNLQLDLSGGLGLTDVSPAGFISAGLSWRIPR